MFVGVRSASELGVSESLFGVATKALQPWNAIDGVNCQAETVSFVVHSQFHRRVDVALLFITAHMQGLVGAGISQAVNQPGIAVEVEDDRLVDSEQRIEVSIGQTVRMFFARLQSRSSALCWPWTSPMRSAGSLPRSRSASASADAASSAVDSTMRGTTTNA